MSEASASSHSLPSTPRGFLPPQLRVLFITGLHRTGGWLAEAFAADGAANIMLDEAVGVARGMSMLRDEAYDAVLVSHEGDSLDALQLVDAIRAGSHHDQPILVLGDASPEELAAECYESGADAYLCVSLTTTRTLLWELARAAERCELLAENRRLQQERQQRLQQERDEARRLLAQQWELIDAEPGAEGEPPAPDLPAQLVDHYQQLLRTYVIMGAGNLHRELTHLADLMAAAFIRSTQVMHLHLYVLGEMIEGLGSRSARHVMNRADLLLAEVLLHLADGYRTRLKSA